MFWESYAFAVTACFAALAALFALFVAGYAAGRRDERRLHKSDIPEVKDRIRWLDDEVPFTNKEGTSGG